MIASAWRNGFGWRHVVVAAVAGLLLAHSARARADDAIRIGAPPAWITPVTEPPPSADAGGVSLRLLDIQSRIDGAGLHQFGHQIIKVSSPAALQAAGNVAVMWQPSFGGATVHQVRILRDGQAIDVLDGGKRFTTIRREAGLEGARLDGQLTAVMQVPDLRVGDEVEVSFTVDSRNPVLADHVEADAAFLGGTRVDRLRIAASWPAGRAVAFRIGDGLPKPVMSKAGGQDGFVLDKAGVTMPIVPNGAPLRFLDAGRVQFSDFGDWNAVARLIAPLFAKAAAVAPGSPLDQEVRRIAASADPKARAAAALRLVQQQVRYFAKLDGLGGYVPESAADVWAARNGDCKGKSALLLALLRGLGIDAVPALVSATRGDGVDRSLPMPGRFDHVIVRATIAGRDYWLDGTRLGDRTLDDLEVPAFKWVLPLSEPTARLAALAPSPATRPDSEWLLDLDARDGLDKPAKAVGTVIFRGDTAVATAAGLAMMDAARRDEAIRRYWSERHDWVTIDKVGSQVDEASGEVRLSFSGTGVMDWDRTGDTPTFRYEANKARLGYDLAPKRDPGDPPSTPVTVARNYLVTHQTILLPDGGKGFTIVGDAIDETIGGVRYLRTVSLKDGRFDMTASSRSNSGEISLADARAADLRTNAIFAKQLFVRLPDTQVAADRAAARAAQGPAPDSAIGAVLKLAAQGKSDEALAAADKLVATDKDNADYLTARAMIRRVRGENEQAGIDVDAALAIDGHNTRALLTKADLVRSNGQLEDALILLDRTVLIDPQNPIGYAGRAEVRAALGRTDAALADYANALRIDPALATARIGRVRLLASSGRRDEAVAEAEAFVKAAPDNPTAHALYGNTLFVVGRKAEGLAAIARSIAIKPTVDAYVTRLSFDASQDAKAATADMIEVIRLDPARALPAAALRRLAGDPPKLAQVMAGYAAALKAVPPGGRADAIRRSREWAEAATGKPEAMLARLDAEVKAKPTDIALRNAACWERATHKLDLDRALADCDAALAIRREAAILDSRGLVRLQRGEPDKAIADYDAALAMRPSLSGSLFARGVAKLRKGDKAGGDADLAAARKASPLTEQEFAGYGVVP